MIHIRSKYPFITTRLPLMAAVLIGSMVAVSATSALAADALEQQQLVEKAKMTVDAFATDPEVGPATREMKGEVRAGGYPVRPPTRNEDKPSQLTINRKP